MGLKCNAIGNIMGEHIGTLGTNWEHKENLMGMSWEADVNRVDNLMGELE
jgi:hypothetical protein